MGIIKRLLQKPLIKNYHTNKEYNQILLALKGEKYRKKMEKQLSKHELERSENV